MNWLYRVAYRNFETGERIIAAAIRIGNRVFTAPMHFLAAQKAKAAGLLRFDYETDKYYTTNGLPWEQGFVTTSGQFLSREEADQYFGIDDSEKMDQQQPAFAVTRRSLVRLSMVSDELKYIRQLQDAARSHLSLSPQTRTMLDNFLPSIQKAFQTRGWISPAQQATWSRIKSQFGLPSTSESCAECGKPAPNRKGDYCEECWKWRRLGT